jgi:hypothetical protein
MKDLAVARVPSPEPLALGVQRAAEVSGLCPRSITYYVASGELPSRKIGKRRLILLSDLRRFLAKDRPAVNTRARE